MDYSAALKYLEGVSWLGSKPGLERISELLERLGRPQDKLHCIHVAGTNGKGSTCAMLRSVLTEAGYRTGLYISPHLVRMNERMSIDGIDVSDAEFAEAVTELAAAAEGMDDACTEFELCTALALHWFAKKGCDAVVLETGLGGRLDATNAINRPDCAVITNIGLDHTAVLGNTVELIAAEKAGIFKGGYAAAYDLPENVRAVLREKAAATGTDLAFADLRELVPLSDSFEGQSFLYRGEKYAITLLGSHQLSNAATALETIAQLRCAGWNIPNDAVKRGLERALWPARFERVLKSPDFVVDGGHNPQCLTATRAALEHYYPNTRRVLLFGALADKSWQDMARLLIPAADEFVCATPDSPRALQADELARFLRAEGCRAEAFDSIDAAAEAAAQRAEPDGMACCVGSLYMAGEVRKYLIDRRRSCE